MNFRHDVSDNTVAWSPLEKDIIYQVNIDVFLMEVGCCGNEPIRNALVPSRADKRGGYYSSPNSISEYLADPVNASRRKSEYGGYHQMKVLGIVKAGTELKPHKIIRNSGYSWWGGGYSSDYKYAKILTGEFTGNIVDIQDVPIYRKTK